MLNKKILILTIFLVLIGIYAVYNVPAWFRPRQEQRIEDTIYYRNMTNDNLVLQKIRSMIPSNFTYIKLFPILKITNDYPFKNTIDDLEGKPTPYIRDFRAYLFNPDDLPQGAVNHFYAGWYSIWGRVEVLELDALLA